jgi:hypothetical protein
MKKVLSICRSAPGLIVTFLIFATPIMLLHSEASRSPPPPVYLPDCDSGDAKDLLKKSIEGAPGAKSLGVKVFDVTDAGARDDSAVFKRDCHAMVFTNAGKIGETYTIEWIDIGKRSYWLQAKADEEDE